jgi:hypothetical protein
MIDIENSLYTCCSSTIEDYSSDQNQAEEIKKSVYSIDGAKWKVPNKDN